MFRSRPIKAYTDSKNTNKIGIKEAAKASNKIRGIKKKLRHLFSCVKFIVWWFCLLAKKCMNKKFFSCI